MYFGFFPMYREGVLTGIFAVGLNLDYSQSLIGEIPDVENEEDSFVIDGEGEYRKLQDEE